MASKKSKPPKLITTSKPKADEHENIAMLTGEAEDETCRDQLFVSFWQLSLRNIPEGAFVHRRVVPEEAKQLIEAARQAGTLRCGSHDDLLAPYNKRERNDHKKLCRVLGEHYGIALSLRDFMLEDDDEEDGSKGYITYPLTLAKVEGSNRLMIVSCHYVLAKKQEKSKIKFDVAPDSVTFHLFEAVGSEG